jgi:hypothetical protein
MNLLLLGSAAAAAIVTAVTTLQVAGRNIQIENITKERAKWREQVRALVDEISQAVGKGDIRGIGYARHRLQLRLNPGDEQDQQILLALTKLVTCPSSGRILVLEEVVARTALLLKHDWERAKYEAKALRIFQSQPRRGVYADASTNPAVPMRRPGMSAWTAWKWLGAMIAAAGVIFFLAAGMAKPFTELVIAFNDSHQSHSRAQWVVFVSAAVSAGLMWSLLHLAFKVAEKKLVDECSRPRKG